MRAGFTAGAEASPVLLRDVEQLLRTSGPHAGERGLSVIYGATEGLPLATCDADVALTPRHARRCALGGGVCLGRAADGVQLSVDPTIWHRLGAHPPLPLLGELGELTAAGPLVAGGGPLATGDLGTIDAEGLVWFFGRAQQTVRCRPPLGSVPPVAVEMVCLQGSGLDRCALVGLAPRAPKSTPHLPVLVVQIASEAFDAGAVRARLRTALQGSLWSPMLAADVRFVRYPHEWPVDARHSSKCNRAQLAKWAASLPVCELSPVCENGD